LNTIFIKTVLRRINIERDPERVITKSGSMAISVHGTACQTNAVTFQFDYRLALVDKSEQRFAQCWRELSAKL